MAVVEHHSLSDVRTNRADVLAGMASVRDNITRPVVSIQFRMRSASTKWEYLPHASSNTTITLRPWTTVLRTKQWPASLM